MKNTLVRIYYLIIKGEIFFMIKGVTKRIYSKTQAYGLKRDLSIPFTIPNAKIDLKLRLYKDQDHPSFSANLHNYGLVEKNIPKCFVATTLDDQPCFRQWLIGPENRQDIKEFWGDAFPDIQEDEMLLEDGFTVPDMRGKGIMSAAITRIIEKEKRPEINAVITFVGADNVASLKGIHRSGFKPYTLRTEKWLLFKRKVLFEDVPKSFEEQYQKKISRSKTF